MNQHNDKLLRDKMNETTFEDLVDSFDEEDIWQQIRKDILPQPKAKKLYGLQYWRYAAVLVLGLLLGFYFNKNDEVEMLTAQRILSLQANHDTVFVAAPVPKITPIASSLNVKKPKLNSFTKEIKKESGDNQEIPLVQETKTDNRHEEKVILVSEKKEINVVYFEDIHVGERLLTNTSDKKSKRKLLQINMPQNKDATTQELPLRSLVYALNQ